MFKFVCIEVIKEFDRAQIVLNVTARHWCCDMEGTIWVRAYWYRSGKGQVQVLVYPTPVIHTEIVSCYLKNLKIEKS